MDVLYACHGSLFFCSVFVCMFPSLGNLSQVVQVMTWFRDTSYDDLIPPNATMTSLPVMRSKLECSRTCLTRVSCNSFFYNDVSKTCAPQWLVFVSPENVTLESGWRYYRLTTELCPKNRNYLIDRISMTCYRPVTSSKTWSAARDACRDSGEMLVVLESFVKMQFVTAVMKVNSALHRQFFIGASRPEGQWNTNGTDFVWLTGRPVDTAPLLHYFSTYFPSKKAKKNVIIISSRGFFLHNADNSWPRAYVCQRALWPYRN